MLFGRTAAFFVTALIAFAVWLWATAPRDGRLPPNVLVIGQIAEPKSLDPQRDTALNDFRILANVYDGLVRFRPGTLQVVPALAERWEIGADGKSYTFHLRAGVRFHDGTAFDADAVRFNFARLLEADHPLHDTGPFPLAFLFQDIAAVETLDARTVRFQLKQPFAPFLSNLAYPTGYMVSPTAVRRYGKDFGRRPVGTGPFRFARWDSGVRVVIERNPDYWEGAPELEAVVFRPLKDANTRAAELLAGGVDVLIEVPADMRAVFRDQTDVAVIEAVGPHLWFLVLNTRHGPFRDRRMRQAVNYAIDKRAIVEDVLQGSAVVADGPVPRAFAWAHDPADGPYPHDPDKARELIGEAGHEGATLKLYAAEGGSGMLQPVAMAAAIQADLARVGLSVEIETFEWNAYLSRVNDGLGPEVDMAEMAWMTNDPDTLPFLALRGAALPDQGGFNSGYYANPRVDALIERARRATDVGVRAAHYRALQAVVREDAPWAFIASWRQAIAFSTRVRGLAIEPSFLLDLRGVGKPR